MSKRVRFAAVVMVLVCAIMVSAPGTALAATESDSNSNGSGNNLAIVHYTASSYAGYWAISTVSLTSNRNTAAYQKASCLITADTLLPPGTVTYYRYTSPSTASKVKWTQYTFSANCTVPKDTANKTSWVEGYSWYKNSIGVWVGWLGYAIKMPS